MRCSFYYSIQVPSKARCQVANAMPPAVNSPWAQQAVGGHKQGTAVAPLQACAADCTNTVRIHPALTQKGSKVTNVPILQQMMPDSHTAPRVAALNPNCGMSRVAWQTEVRCTSTCSTWEKLPVRSCQSHLLPVSLPFLPSRPLGGFGSVPPPVHPDCSAHDTNPTWHC